MILEHCPAERDQIWAKYAAKQAKLNAKAALAARQKKADRAELAARGLKKEAPSACVSGESPSLLPQTSGLGGGEGIKGWCGSGGGANIGASKPPPSTCCRLRDAAVLMNLAPVAELDGADTWDEADPFDGSQHKEAARPAKRASQKAPPLSPEARRQRRLASNRMAAKVAWRR